MKFREFWINKGPIRGQDWVREDDFFEKAFDGKNIKGWEPGIHVIEYAPIMEEISKLKAERDELRDKLRIIQMNNCKCSELTLALGSKTTCTLCLTVGDKK